MNENKELDHFKNVQWQQFIQSEQLTPAQSEQFQMYLIHLLATNDQMNLTTIVKPDDIIAYHFQDSLRIGSFIDMSLIHGIADVGAGGGFPGIPLKIKYPHLKMVLIEVNTKKARFLQEVIDMLGLDDIQVCTLDWRTFLRKTNFKIDVFVARASLSMEELFRLFKPGCRYNKAGLIYWASADWKLNPLYSSYLVKEEKYTVKNRNRRFAFFALKSPEGTP